MTDTNGNGSSVKFTLSTVITGIFAVLAIIIGFNYTIDARQDETLDRKLDKQEFKECKIDLVVNQAAMEQRIMMRMDKIDKTLETHTQESVEALRKAADKALEK